MKSCAWLAVLLSALFVLSACEKEKKETPLPRQTETAPTPTREEMQTPSEQTQPSPGGAERPQAAAEGKPEDYVTPQEGESRGMQNLEVVDKNVSEATGQPSTIGTPEEVSRPETVVLEAKNGNITFDHKAHSEREDCTSCHQQSPPEKIELNMESAHKLCRGCHQERGAGPQKCADCHKKV